MFGGPVLCSGCVKQIDSQFDLVVGESKIVNLLIGKGGVISGSIKDALSQTAIKSLEVKIYSDNESYLIESNQDDNLGTFSFSGIPNGNYKIYLKPRLTNDSLFNEYVPQIYNGGECVYCIEKVIEGIGQDLTIMNFGTLNNINFELSKGAKIQGVVVDETTLTADFRIGIVVVVNESSNIVAASIIFESTDGVYTVGGLLPGRYYVYAYTSVTGSFGSIYPYQRMLFANKPCYFTGCNFTEGDVVELAMNETIGPVDFHLKLGGLIQGSIFDSVTGNPIKSDKDFFLTVYDSNEKVVGGSHITPVYDGYYVTDAGIPPGTYSVKVGNSLTGQSSAPYVEKKYNNVDCIGLACDLASVNVSVLVDHQTSNIDFSLAKGYTINGNVLDSLSGIGIGNVNLLLYKSLDNGNVIKYASFTKSRDTELDNNGVVVSIGSFSFSGLPEGEYYLGTNNGANLPFTNKSPGIHGKWIDKLYGDIPCPASTCDFSQGSVILLNAANPVLDNIDITLVEASIISGRAFDVNNQIIEGIEINLFSNTGIKIGQFNTDHNGYYQSVGLPTGTYYMTTSSNDLWRDVTYGDELCNLSCNPLDGDSVTLTQQDLLNIDFTLTRIDGVIFINGFE